MHPLLLETPLYALCDRYRLNMTAFVLFLDHLDHAFDLIEYGLALRRNILRGLFRACRGDAPGIVNAKADLFEDEGKRGDGPSNTLDFNVGIRNFDAHCVEY